MKDLIINYLRKNGKSLYDDFLVLGDNKEIDDAINELLAEYVIVKQNDRYGLIETFNMFKGVIDLKKNGFGFVMIEGRKDDIFIPKGKTLDAMNKDEVLVRVIEPKYRGSVEAEVIKVIKRVNKYIVGLYDSKKSVVIPDDKNKDFRVKISKENSMGAFTNHKVKVEITNIKKNLIEGKIIEIIGHVNDPGVDILSIIANYDVPIAFPDNVMEEVNNINDYVSDFELSNRVDLTNEMIVTIDGDDAKDLDDAISLKILDNGNYLLGVHIADVANYVKENTALDDEAYYRGTSVYLVDRVIPMLPHKLSNGICSLNEGVIRLTMSCMMEIDKGGNVISSNIFESFIRSSKRMTYNKVNKVLLNDPITKKEYDKFNDLIYIMDDLREILNWRRRKNGSIDFEVNEPKIIVDDLGTPIDVVSRVRGDAEKMIEEFMLIANQTVAETIYHMDLPFIYRVHERPDEKKLLLVFRILKNLGYNIRGSISNISPKEIQRIMDNVTDDSKKVINTLLLRSMAKAKYSHEELGHYGLAFKYYTHFTSPIRRYPDTIVHRLLKEYLVKNNINNETINKWESKMPNIGIRTSKRERVAIELEREVNDMKMAEYMVQFIGQEFKGIISSITSFGMFVELENSCEGLVHILDLKDDRYYFDDRFMELIGRHKRKVFKIGDKVIVRVKAASKEKSEIDFDLVKQLTKPLKRR